MSRSTLLIGIILMTVALTLATLPYLLYNRPGSVYGIFHDRNNSNEFYIELNAQGLVIFSSDDWQTHLLEGTFSTHPDGMLYETKDPMINAGRVVFRVEDDELVVQSETMDAGTVERYPRAYSLSMNWLRLYHRWFGGGD